MQNGRAVAIQNPFGITCGSGGITKRRGGLLRKDWPLILVGFGIQQLFVTDQTFYRAIGHVGPVCHHHNTLQRRKLVDHRLQKRHKGQINKKITIFCMINNVKNLLRK